jgi:hypothetical protein
MGAVEQAGTMRPNFVQTRLRRTLAVLGAALLIPLLHGRSPQTGAPVMPAVLTVTFAQLAACPLLDPAEDAVLPSSVRIARNRDVRVVGYMLPLKVEHGRVREFLLMRDQTGCCFGRMPTANEFIVVQADGAGLPITMDVPLTLEGTLRIAPLIFEGSFAQFYRLENARAVTSSQ